MYAIDELINSYRHTNHYKNSEHRCILEDYANIVFKQKNILQEEKGLEQYGFSYGRGKCIFYASMNRTITIYSIVPKIFVFFLEEVMSFFF